jgi:hypothetical protein
LYWYSRPEDIPPETVDETIDKVANLFVRRLKGMGGVAKLLLEVNIPFVYIYGELGRFFMTPIFSMLEREEEGNLHNYITIFEQRENIRRLIQRIKDMEEEDKKLKKEENETAADNQKKSWFRKIFS